MSSMKKPGTSFDSVASVLDYLREPSPSEVVISSTTSTEAGSTNINILPKSTRGRKKEKERADVMNGVQINAKDVIEVLPSGRVRFGPIVINPRKQPSKTLFTGRRSKYEKLSASDEEKRRVRRERNRIAATRCREKRDNVLEQLEKQWDEEINKNKNLLKTIQELKSTKSQLETLLSGHIEPCRMDQTNQMTSSQQQQQQPGIIYNSMNYPISTIDASSTNQMSSNQFQLIQNTEENFEDFLQPAPPLTNSGYNDNYSNSFINMDQQYQQSTINMSTSSFNQLFQNIEPPAPCIDNNNNNCSALFNSAYGSSTCAQQHSSSSEDDSFLPTHNDAFAC